MVGLVLVAASVVLGARLVAAADDTVEVWSVRADLPAGQPLSAADVEVAAVRFTDAAQASAYVSAGDPVPDGEVLARPVTAGELLPRAALGGTAEGEYVEVPLAVPADGVVASLEVGQRVDVWVTTPPVQGETPVAERVLSDVRVVEVPGSETALGPTATRQVVVAVPAEDERLLEGALARLATGVAVVVRRP